MDFQVDITMTQEFFGIIEDSFVPG